MYFLLKLIVGGGIAAVGLKVVKAPIGVLFVAFGVLGIGCQLSYARLLNNFLQGEDPVRRFGAHSFNQLRQMISIPPLIITLEVLSKAFLFAAFIALTRILHIFGA